VNDITVHLSVFVGTLVLLDFLKVKIGKDYDRPGSNLTID